MNSEEIKQNEAQKYVAEKLNKFIKKSGELVSKDEEKYREKQCEGCPYNGMVNPVPGIHVEGCTACECPFGSKRKMKWIPRLKNSNDKPLSAIEILKMKVYEKFDSNRIEKVIIKCSHPDGNRWEGYKEQQN